MKWMRFRVRTRTDAEDILISFMEDIGLYGAQIEDNVPLSESDLQQMFVDIPLAEGPDDGIAYIDFYLDEDADAQALLDAVRQELDGLRRFTEIGECSIEESVTEDKDWVNNWKQYFHKFKVDDILIIPSWEDVEPDDDAKMVLHIDPGTAFGTGMHETTQLCMRQLKKYVAPDTELLDVGTGSGILSIVALKLGAKHAFGTDLDPCTVNAVSENLAANGIPEEKMDLVIGNIIDDPSVQDQAGLEKYDIVTANILADVLTALTPEIVKHMKHGALYISSGILDVKEKDVTDACRAQGLEIVEITRQGEWVSVTARRN